jgi:hypothetical protein
MSDKNSINLLRLLGQTESNLNQIIQNRLNEKQVINVAQREIQKHTKSLNKIRQMNELIAQQLHVPTKDDIANIARLVIQIEEKIDLLEEKISILTEEIQSSNLLSNRRSKRG